MNYNYKPTKIYINKLEKRIKDAIEYLEELNTHYLVTDFDTERLIRILKGEEIC